MRKKLLQAVLFAIAALALLTPCASPLTASADAAAEWYRIEKENVLFYKSPPDTADNVVFTLEYTYFVRPLSSSGAFFEVQLYENRNGFVKMTGYVRIADLEPYAKTPVPPLYPEVSLTVTASTTLKKTPSNSGEDIAAVFSGKTVMYYGRAVAPDWYFVRADGDFGYLPASRLSPLSIPVHPVPLVEEPETPVVTDPVPDPEPPEKDKFALEIVLILLICIPALIIVVLLFLPRKNTPTKNERLRQAHRPKYLDDSAYFDDLDLL